MKPSASLLVVGAGVVLEGHEVLVVELFGLLRPTTITLPL
jgi:hypothetical protein